MTTDRILALLDGVRPCGSNKWIARCPAHEDRSPSLTIRETNDRILIHCWAGCTAANICAAVGLSLADLYSESRYRPDPIVLRRRRAVEALETWRQSELSQCAEDLRTRDTIIRHINDAVHSGELTEGEASVSLGHEYDGYSQLEYRFDQLLRNQDTLELWRESRSA